MTSRAKSYDPRCYELAALFLSDEPDLNTEAARITLASEIQSRIEDEIEFMRSTLAAAKGESIHLDTKTALDNGDSR
ncbi:hypothetical protein [Afipia sp. DC4300-2b1]|uniref:hypothetical protein n=1 Tax=Afipia sp. DC4300-2b1 TaxID=2804672 RepID=UPI003CEA099E